MHKVKPNLVTPTKYLVYVRWVMQNMPAEFCEVVLNGIAKEYVEFRAFSMPDYIPVKYHPRMHKVWKTMALRTLFENAVRKYTLAQRHKILQKCLER